MIAMNRFFLISSLFFASVIELFSSPVDIETDKKIAKNLNPEKGKIGITYTLGKSYIAHLPSIESDSYYENNYHYSVGVNYIYLLNSWLKAETGIEYSEYSIKLFVYPDGVTYFAGTRDLSLISIPLILRADFSKFFFANAGTFVDLDFKNKSEIFDNQTGMGIIAGLGVKYDFKSGISLFTNPFVRLHNLIPFVLEKYPDRLFDAGVRFGITYDLNKK